MSSPISSQTTNSPEQKDQPASLPVIAKLVYSFPNQQEGHPFSVEAGSREEAIAANAAYLKSLKKETA